MFRGIYWLRLVLTAVLILVGANAARGIVPSITAPPAMAANQTFAVDFSDQNNRGNLSGTLHPDVLAVRNSLRPALVAIGDAGMAPSVVAAELQHLYPGLVSEESSALYYIWRFCEDIGEFKWVCCGLTTFQVLLTTTVQVDVEVTTFLN